MSLVLFKVSSLKGSFFFPCNVAVGLSGAVFVGLYERKPKRLCCLYSLIDLGRCLVANTEEVACLDSLMEGSSAGLAVKFSPWFVLHSLVCSVNMSGLSAALELSSTHHYSGGGVTANQNHLWSVRVGYSEAECGP